MILGKKKFIGVTILAVIMAGLGLFYIYSQTLICDGPNPYQFRPAEVMVAKVALEKGDLLKKEDLLVKEIPQQLLPVNPLLLRDLDIYLGQPLGAAVDEGAMLLTSEFIEQTRKFVLNDLSLDERTLKIDGDAIHSMAAGIGPQDYIDVMVTLTDEEQTRSVVLLQRVQVVDVEDDGSSRSITLAVTADEAEVLAIFQTEAKLNILARDADNEDYSGTESVGVNEVLEAVDIINRHRVERNLMERHTGTAAANLFAMEVPESSIRSLPSGLEAGSRIDVLGVMDPEKLAIETFEEFTALTLLQDVLVLAADESITVSLTHEEAHLLSMMQVSSIFHILTRHPIDTDTVPITRQTIKDAPEDLEVLQERRKQRRDQVIGEHRRYCGPDYVFDVHQNRCVPFRAID